MKGPLFDMQTANVTHTLESVLETAVVFGYNHERSDALVESLAGDSLLKKVPVVTADEVLSKDEPDGVDLREASVVITTSDFINRFIGCKVLHAYSKTGNYSKVVSAGITRACRTAIQQSVFEVELVDESPLEQSELYVVVSQIKAEDGVELSDTLTQLLAKLCPIKGVNLKINVVSQAQNAPRGSWILTNWPAPNLVAGRIVALAKTWDEDLREDVLRSLSASPDDTQLQTALVKAINGSMSGYRVVPTRLLPDPVAVTPTEAEQDTESPADTDED